MFEGKCKYQSLNENDFPKIFVAQLKLEQMSIC